MPFIRRSFDKINKVILPKSLEGVDCDFVGAVDELVFMDSDVEVSEYSFRLFNTSKIPYNFEGDLKKILSYFFKLI